MADSSLARGGDGRYFRQTVAGDDSAPLTALRGWVAACPRNSRGSRGWPRHWVYCIPFPPPRKGWVRPTAGEVSVYWGKQRIPSGSLVANQGLIRVRACSGQVEPGLPIGHNSPAPKATGPLVALSFSRKLQEVSVRWRLKRLR